MKCAGSVLAGVVAAGTFWLTGCKAGEAAPSASADSAAVATGTAAVQEQLEEPAERPPNIYYDLTRYGWYERAEPLVHEGRPHQVAGRPVTARLSAMEHIGTYEGVDYYRARDTTATTLYVPVYEGFWLPFEAAGVTSPS